MYIQDTQNLRSNLNCDISSKWQRVLSGPLDNGGIGCSCVFLLKIKKKVDIINMSGYHLLMKQYLLWIQSCWGTNVRLLFGTTCLSFPCINDLIWQLLSSFSVYALVIWSAVECHCSIGSNLWYAAAHCTWMIIYS